MRRTLITSLVALGLIVPMSGNGTCGSTREKIAPTAKDKLQTEARADFYPEYSALIKALQENGVDVPEPFRKNVHKYLGSKKGIALIGLEPSSAGLTWYFHRVVFLRMDLLFVSYEDGQMYGGDLLVKIDSSDNKVISMRTLWNSAK